MTADYDNLLSAESQPSAGIPPAGMRADDWEKLSRQLDPKEGHMSDQSNAPQPEGNVETAEAEAVNEVVADAVEQPDTDAAEVAVAETGTEVEEQVEAPTVEDLLLKDHKQKVLGKDRISRKQMVSYLKFLGSDPESGELINPLEHPLLTDTYLAELDVQAWLRVARYGKNTLGEHAKEVDEAYIEMWDEHFGTHQGYGNSNVPHSHMWLKGVMAAAFLIAEYVGEQEIPVLQERQPEEASTPTEAAIAAAASEEQQADDAAESAEAGNDTEGETPESEQDEQPEDESDEDESEA